MDLNNHNGRHQSNAMGKVEDIQFLEELGSQPIEQNDKDNKDKRWYERCVGLGIGLTVLKVILSCIPDLLVQKLKHISPVVLLFFRSQTMLTLILPVSILFNRPPFPADKTLKDRILLVLRGVFGTLGAMAIFYSLQHMPLGDQKMILATRPVITILSARLFLKEACGFAEVFSTVLMMSGVFLVIKPTFIFGSSSTDQSELERDGKYLESALLLLGSTVLTANVAIILKFLRKTSALSIMITREIVYSVLTFIVIISFGLPFFLPEPMERLEVLFMACGSILVQGLNIAALRFEEANKIAVVDRSSSIVVAYVVQIIVTNDSPNLYTTIGVVLVLLAIFTIGAKKIFCQNNSGKVEETTEQDGPEEYHAVKTGDK